MKGAVVSDVQIQDVLSEDSINCEDTSLLHSISYKLKRESNKNVLIYFMSFTLYTTLCLLKLLPLFTQACDMDVVVSTSSLYSFMTSCYCMIFSPMPTPDCYFSVTILTSVLYCILLEIKWLHFSLSPPGLNLIDKHGILILSLVVMLYTVNMVVDYFKSSSKNMFLRKWGVFFLFITVVMSIVLTQSDWHFHHSICFYLLSFFCRGGNRYAKVLFSFSLGCYIQGVAWFGYSALTISPSPYCN
jgi:hypothetical protein